MCEKLYLSNWKGKSAGCEPAIHLFSDFGAYMINPH